MSLDPMCSKLSRPFISLEGDEMFTFIKQLYFAQ